MKNLFTLLFVLLFFSVLTYSQNADLSAPSGFTVEQKEMLLQQKGTIEDLPAATTRGIIRWSEGFEGATFPPDGWAVHQLDGGANTWLRYTSTPIAGTASASVRYESSTLMNDDWLVTPQFLVNPGDLFRFYAKGSTSFYDSVQIYVSTAGGTPPAGYTYITSYRPTTLAMYEVPLNAYAGQNVYMAFRYYALDELRLYVDSVYVETPLDNDVGMYSVDLPPSSLPGSMICKATVKNYGALPQSFNVTMTITPGSYTSTKQVTNLTSGNTMQVEFDNWNALLGSYTVNVTTALTGDGNPSNDHMNKPVIISSAMWSTGAPIPIGSYMGTAAGYVRNDTGFVFAAGGNTTNKNDLQMYNVTTNTWSTKAPIPVPRVVTSSAVSGNTYYVIGGSDGAATPAYVNTVYAYDIPTNTWTTKAPLPANRGWLKAVAYQDSLIYVAGGYDGTNYVADIYLYNINTNSWRQATSMPGTRIGGAFGVFEDRLVYVGGAATVVEATTFVGIINQSDRSQITWSTGAAYPAGPRFRWDAASWGSAGLAFAGGSPTTTWTGSNDGSVYNPVTNTWTPLAGLKPTISLGSYVASVHFSNNDIKLIMASGYNSAILTVNEIYMDNVMPVPVELASFKVDVSGSSVTLNWITSTETNNRGFEVERSFNGSAFDKLGFVSGNGTTTEIKTYSFADSKLAAGKYSYRLKQLDYDGTYEYSNTVEVDIIGVTAYSLDQNYPNPFNPSTVINFTLSADSRVSLRVFDILGQEVAVIVNTAMTTGAYTYSFDASNLNSGVYFYQLEAQGNDGSNFKSIKKMMLTK